MIVNAIVSESTPPARDPPSSCKVSVTTSAPVCSAIGFKIIFAKNSPSVYSTTGFGTVTILSQTTAAEIFVGLVLAKTDNGSRAPANADNRADSFFVDVAVELTNGLYDNQNAVTVPSDILKVEEEDISFGSPVPDSVKYDNKVQIDPVKPEENEEQQQTMTQQGDSLKKTNLSNASKNTKIPSKSATPSPAVNENYTSQYMPING